MQAFYYYFLFFISFCNFYISFSTYFTDICCKPKHKIKMRGGINKVIVRTRKIVEDEIEYGGLKLLKSGPIEHIRNTAHDLHIEQENQGYYNPMNDVRIYAEVVSLPTKLSGGYLTSKYVGSPHPKPYRPAHFEDRVERDKETIEAQAKKYCPGLFENTELTLSNLPMEVQPGDRIYFHYLGLNKDSYLETIDGEHLYEIDYDTIFCVVREGKIIPICGHVLCEPFYGEDVQDLGNGVRGKLGNHGLVTELNEKPKHLEAVVRYNGENIGFTDINVSSGDRIYYTINSDFSNEIEGKEYYVMKQWDIFAKNNGNIPEPVGNWVMLKPNPAITLTKLGLILPFNETKIDNIGTVLKTGPNPQDVLPGQKVIFNSKSTFLIKIPDQDVWFIPIEDIYGVIG